MRNTSFSFGLSTKLLAPPVTEMIKFGASSRHLSKSSRKISLGFVSWDTRTNWKIKTIQSSYKTFRAGKTLNQKIFFDTLFVLYKKSLVFRPKLNVLKYFVDFCLKCSYVPNKIINVWCIHVLYLRRQNTFIFDTQVYRVKGK